MPLKVFVTGATGYIGGDGLYEMSQAHPEWEITCLVRNSDKGAKIAAKYAKVKLVYGDLDAVDLIEEEASKADIVYHFANCDHEASAHAIARGLARRQGSAPAYWIHTSGTMILAWQTDDEEKWGIKLPKIFNDWDGVDELTSQPDRAAHRVVDKIVLAASKAQPEKIKTAIVCPPTIYGRGRGPDNQRSAQAYRTAAWFLKHKRAWTVRQGTNIWHQVHVKDLSKLYLLLGEAAANGGAPATWNEEGYYLAENGEFEWGSVLRAIAAEISERDLVKIDKVEELDPDDVEKLMPYSKYSVGTNSRGVSRRGKELLGWQPREQSLLDEVPIIVQSEALLAGIISDREAEQ